MSTVPFTELVISVRLTSSETKKVMRQYPSGYPAPPAEVIVHTLTFGQEGADRYVVLRFDEAMLPESMRNASLGTPFRLRLTNEWED